MTAQLIRLQHVTSSFVHQIIAGVDTDTKVNDISQDVRDVMRRQNQVRQVIRRVPSLLRAQAPYRFQSYHSGALSLPISLLERVADELDSNSRESFAVSCRAIYEAVALPSTMECSRPPTPKFNRAMLAHREHNFEDLRVLRLRFWPYVPEGFSGIEPHLWLGHCMANLQSLTLDIGPALSKSQVQNRYEKILTYPDYGFFDIPGVRQSSAKPMPRLTSLKIELKITRGPYGYLQYDNPWDEPSEWLIPSVIFSEGSTLRRCSLEEVRWPRNHSLFFESLVAFHHKGELMVLNEVVLGDLTSNAPALSSIWLEAMSFKPEDADLCATLSDRQPYARLKHVAIGLQNDSERLDLTLHLLKGGAHDVLVTLTSLRSEGPQTAPYNVSSMWLGVTGIAYHSASRFVEHERNSIQSSGIEGQPTQRTRVSIMLQARNPYRFDEIVAATLRAGQAQLANLVSLNIHERFAVRLFEPSSLPWTWFPPATFYQAGDSEHDLVAALAGENGTTAPSISPQVSFSQLEDLTICFASCWETRRTRSLGMFYSDSLFIERPAPDVGTKRFPRVRTLRLSAGTIPRRLQRNDNKVETHKVTSYHCSDNRRSGILAGDVPPGCACDVEAGFPIELRAVEELVRGCAFPAISSLQLCGLQCTDVDIVGPLLRLQDVVEVEFKSERVPTDVQDISREGMASHADEIFKLLEQS